MIHFIVSFILERDTMTTTIAPRSKSPIVSFYTLFIRSANTLQSPLLLLIRLYIGYQCVVSGYRHITHLQQMVKNFNDWHVPAPSMHIAGWNVPTQKINVEISAVTEMGCGSLLLLGFSARLISIPLIANFVVALLTVELSNYDFSFRELGAQIWKDQSPILGDTAFPFLAAAIVVLIFGPGWLSIDGLIKFIRSK
jgi:putative oxidoreductase